jgi:hypothetical protein
MGVLLLDEQTAPGTPSTGQVVLYPKSDGLLYSKDDAGAETAVTGLAAASQAEQEAGSSTLVATTPGRQHFHPSTAKAWVRFGGATAVIASSYNVTSITDNGVGTYQVNFTTAMADANYNVLAAHGDTSRGGTATSVSGWTTTDFDMGTSHEATADTTVFVDPTAVEVVVFGDM